MLVDIYSSNKHFGKHLSVPSGSKDPKLLAAIDPDFGSMSLVNARVKIAAGVPHQALDAADVIAQINKNGYALAASSLKCNTLSRKVFPCNPDSAISNSSPRTA